MTIKPCAYCQKDNPDTQINFTYEVKRTIPHVLPSGQFSHKEWTEQTREYTITLPVHVKCRTKRVLASRIIIGIGLLGPIFVVVDVAAQLLAPSLHRSITPYFSTICGVGIVLTVVAGNIELNYLPWRTRSTISAWLSRWEPDLWNKMHSI